MIRLSRDELLASAVNILDGAEETLASINNKKTKRDELMIKMVAAQTELLRALVKLQLAGLAE